MIRIFSLFIALVLLACGVYFGKLYRQTTALFENLKPDLTQASDISQAELFIGDLLFDSSVKNHASPAALIARGQLNAHPQDAMFNYHIKVLILAYRLNNSFSDEQLLSTWLSSVYFGKGEYGLEVAAQSLFNKNTDNLV